jgi:hypothetical protein
MARLRSRITWLGEGDANTKFFHIHARHRKRRNFVAKLVDGSHILTEHSEKAAAVDLFYKNLIGQDGQRDVTIDLAALGLPRYNLAALDSPFTEKEVLETIKGLPSDKAPGPDGFTGLFYKVCWNIVKSDIMAVVSAVWCRRFGNFWKLNTAFITMVPKKDGAEQVKDFRPISLVHSIAKLITKILANRLAPRLNELVSPNQSAFIKGRFIQDNFMLVQQTSRLFHQQRLSRLLLKLDITKAFDSVSWPFLIEVMQQFGFGQIWRDMVCGLLASSTTQVMLNGFPGQQIQHRRGLRQGDPLSPMLFILVMDVLGHLFIKAEEAGLLQQLAARRQLHRVSIYADDVALFLHPTVDEISITLDILQLFGSASGLKNNVQKSNVYPIQCSEETLLEVQSLLPCEIAAFPCKYLGLPLSLHKLSKQHFQPYVDKFADQLPNWKADLMTRAGRRILVQHVLTGMTVYLAMAIDIPHWAVDAIDKIRKGFLWRGRKKLKGDTVWWLGARCVAHFSLVDWVSLVYRNLDGPSGCDGCGYKKPTPEDLGQGFLFRFQVKPERSSVKSLSRW